MDQYKQQAFDIYRQSETYDSSVDVYFHHVINRFPDTDIMPAYVLGDIRQRILDWLTLSVRVDAKWLHSVDQNGVPNKFKKIRDWEDACIEANRFTERHLQNSGKSVIPKDEDEDKVFSFADQYSIVLLKSPSAFEREGDMMQHCLGTEEYEETTNSIYSLRDPLNRPHATMEVKVVQSVRPSVELIQIKGKQNEMPKPEYKERVFNWLIAFGAEKEITRTRMGM